jgi:hypothetical protein
LKIKTGKKHQVAAEFENKIIEWVSFFFFIFKKQKGSKDPME